MRKEVSILIFAVFIVVAAVLIVNYLNVGLTGFAIFQQNTNATFSEGNYNNVLYNGSAIVLAANQTNGTYISKILDANGSVTWSNLTWQGSGVTFQLRSCSVANCSETNFTTVSNLSNLNLSGRYFQYQASFDSINDTLVGVAIATYNATQQATNATQQVTPTVSISEPTGTKTSSASIPINFTTVGENLNCIFRVESTSGGSAIQDNTTLAGCSNTSFNLNAGDGSYIFRIYVTGLNGSAYNDSDFSVASPTSNTPVTPVNNTPVNTPVTPPTPIITQISLGDLGGQDIIQGDSKQLTLSAQNTGTVLLTSCSLKGDNSGLMTVTDSAKNIASGQGATFSFSINTSKEVSPGAYTLGFSVNCDQITENKTVTVNVLQKKLDFNITSVQRTSGSNVRVDYTLKELSGQNQNVSILFSIINDSGLQVANTSQNDTINANKTNKFTANIPVNKSLEGNLTLSATFNSQIFSSPILKPITLGASIGGFAIFTGTGGTGNIVLIIVVVVVLVAIFFVVKKLRKSVPK